MHLPSPFYMLREGLKTLTVQGQWQLRRGSLPPSIGEIGEKTEQGDLTNVPYCTSASFCSILRFLG